MSMGEGKNVQLSKRLRALAGLVSSGHVLADVGCDHGHIPIYLVQNGLILRAIAMDISEGPLKRAEENIRAYGLLQYIELRQSDGLKGLRANEADTILISGMGGPLMERILSEGCEVIQNDTELILQPQSELAHFREFLSEHSYEIIDEDMVKEDGKFYPMMKVKKGESHYTKLEHRYGPLLLRRRHPVLLEYLHYEQKKQKEIGQALDAQQSGRALERKQQLQRELEYSGEALKYYEM